MWIGTFGGGLDLAIKENNRYTFRHFFTKTFGQRRTRAIIEDSNGWIWVGNSDGVYVFSPRFLQADPQNYLTYNYNNGKLRSNEIKHLPRHTEPDMDWFLRWRP